MRVEGRTITAFEAPLLGDVVRHIIKEKEEKKEVGNYIQQRSFFLLLPSSLV